MLGKKIEPWESVRGVGIREGRGLALSVFEKDGHRTVGGVGEGRRLVGLGIAMEMWMRWA